MALAPKSNDHLLSEAIAPDPRFRGYHVLLDYIEASSFKTSALADYFRQQVLPHLDSAIIVEYSTDRMIAETVFHIIFRALIDNGINVVHKKLIVFEQSVNAPSPPGFTSVMLLDESHASAHCYSEMGLLAIDCFTCGGNPQATKNVAASIHKSLTTIFPDIKSKLHLTHRFPYEITI